MTTLFDMQPLLVGDKVTLRPLAPDDFDALYAVARDPDIWAMHPFRNRYKLDVFKVFFADAIESRGAFAIINNANGEIIGSTRFAHYDAEGCEIEIGWTFFATAYWRTGTNRAVKALMLEYIFRFVLMAVFHIGATNFRSRSAVERLGGRLVLEHKRHHDDKWHDYTTYHLTREDAMSGALASQLAIA